MPPFLTHRNRKLSIDQSRLISASLEETYLSADIAAASGTLTVANIDGFSINKVLLLNPFSEKAEFVKTHASTAPTGSTITLAANTVYAHSMGEKVYLVQFNNVELAWSATTTGTKTALTTTLLNGLVALEADNKTITYNEREKESGYYFGRFVSNIGAAFTVSGATITSAAHGLVNGDIVKLIAATTIPTGFSTTVAYYVVSAATNTFSVSLTSGGAAVSASDSGTGTLTWYRTSEYSDALPYGGWVKNSVGYMIERSLRDLDLKLTEKVTLTDCFAWLNDGIELIQGKLKRWPEHYSYNYTLPTTITDGTVTYTLPTDIYDTETNKSVLAVRLEDVTGPLQWIDPTGFSALDSTREGDPTHYTIRNSLLALWPTPDGHTGDDIYMDYAKVATSVDSDSDTIDYQRYAMLQDYLTWRIKMKARNNGTLDEEDGFYKSFRQRMNDAIRTLPANNLFRMSPKINRMLKNPGRADDLANIPWADQ